MNGIEFDAKTYKDKRGEFNNEDENLLILHLTQEKDLKMVLDVGCGDGVFTRRVKQLLPGTEILAIDSSPDQIKFAVSEPSNIDFKLADILDFSSESKFDCVYSFYAFPHIPKSKIINALKSIKSLLNEGSKFYLFTNICLFDTSIASKEEQEMCDVVFLNNWESQINLISIEEMREMFKITGFEETHNKKLETGARIKDYGEMVSWVFVLE
jgi:trans-aconitate methyltransferase